MGLYDRDYYRHSRGGGFGGGGFNGPRTMIGWIILLNVGVFIANLFSEGRGFEGGAINNSLALSVEVWKHPLQAYQLITYAFAHAGIFHIAFNMYFLWLFGQEEEAILGPREFLLFYLAGAIAGGLAHQALLPYFAARGFIPSMIGASGAVQAVVLLHAARVPHRQLLIWGIAPVPMWALAAFFVGVDVYQFLQGGGNTANYAHLAGAALGLAYFNFHWRFERLLDWKPPKNPLKRRPKLKVHREENPYRSPESDNDEDGEVDRILDKISREGQESLTAAEKKTLQQASRRYRGGDR